MTVIRVLGIDPGSYLAGWGIVRRQGATVTHVASGVLRVKRDASFGERLRSLHAGLEEVLSEHPPDVVALESVFHAKHARSALQLGHARGVLLLAAAQLDLPIHEYPPATVKKSVTGDGAADKDQVKRMVELLLKMKFDGPADRTDALAIALCDAQAGPLMGKRGGSWEAKLAAAPRAGRLRRTKG